MHCGHTAFFPSVARLTVLMAAFTVWPVVQLAAQAQRAEADLPSYKPKSKLKGEILIARLEPTEAFIATWAKNFAQLYPDAKVSQTPQGTRVASDCYNWLLAGKVQVAPFVRELQEPELAEGRQKLGYEPLTLAIATGSYAMNGNSHALAIYVNAKNPLTKVTLTQLDAIYSKTRRRGYPTDITTWGQLGLTGEWADKPIHAYGMVSRRNEVLVEGRQVRRQTPSIPGVTFFFVDRAMLGGDFKPNINELPDHPIPGASTALGRKNNTVFADIVRSVANDRYGIAYSGFPELIRQVEQVAGEKEYANALPGTKTIAVAENADAPFFAGTPADVASRHYPLSRKIYVVVNSPAGRAPDPALHEFLRYALSREGQQAVAEDPQRFLPLPATVAAEERAKLH